MTQPMELYIHIPFCVKKCAYCDFLSFPAGKEIQERYIDRLISDIKKAGTICRDRTLDTVFIGGGTPSLPESSGIVRIMEAVKQSFSFSETPEISLEANPGTVTKEKLLDYKTVGINRLSFGLQSANKEELKLLGRIHTFEEFLESFSLARACGFSNINVDLMSALPGQTEESWKKTLETVCRLKPEHISAYSLILEEETPFWEIYEKGEGKKLLPNEETERRIYHDTKEILASWGYTRYEISNYAKKGKKCRHNTGYWRGVPYLGLGLGASSYLDGCRFTVTDDMETYLKEEPCTFENRQVLTKQDMEEEFFYVGLRMTNGVSLTEFKDRFGADAKEIYPGLMEKFVKEGAAFFQDDRFILTDYGLDVSNYIMAQFLQD